MVLRKHKRFLFGGLFTLLLLVVIGTPGFVQPKTSVAQMTTMAANAVQKEGFEVDTAVTEPLPANCRYGAATVSDNQEMHWFPEFGIGWYVNFNVQPHSIPPANYAEFVHTIRFNRTFDDIFYPIWPPLTDDGLGAKLDEYPGATWLVGNEMEVDHWTGEHLYPQEYATFYHDVYNYIKDRDPSAQVGIGSNSMSTPGRQQYLDLTWDYYQATYGVTLPVDIWNTHLYILAESDIAHGQGDGRIALGTDPSIAKRAYYAPYGSPQEECSKDEVYCRAEHDSLTIFTEQVVSLRTWMKAHGLQNKPLIISEYSQLYLPDYADEFGNGYPPSRVNAYMEATFDYLENAADPDIGYPADNNRLVQRWLWYPIYTPIEYQSGYVSNLLKDNFTDYPSGDIAAMTEIGLKYRAEVLPRETHVNLMAGNAASVTANNNNAVLKVGFRNNGTTYINAPFDVTFYADADLTEAIGTATVDPVITGCHWHTDTHFASVTWTDLAAGVYPYYAKIDSANQIAEANENDNITSGLVFVSGNVTPTPTAMPTDTEAPTLNWTTPVGNNAAYLTTESETISLAVNATDNIAVERVRFYRWDAALQQWLEIDEVTSSPFSTILDADTLPDGWNQVNARAYDAAGNGSMPRTIWIVKNDVINVTATPTTVPTATNTPTPTATPIPQNIPWLTIPTQIQAQTDRPVEIPVEFIRNGNLVNSAIFSLTYDPMCLSLDLADIDDDGIPDSMQFNLPSDYTGSVDVVNGRLDFVLADTSNSPSPLPNGDIIQMSFMVVCEPNFGQQTETAIQFINQPSVVFGTSDNGSIGGYTFDGSILISPLEKSLLPIVNKKE